MANIIQTFPRGNGGSEITVDSALNTTSENPVQNKVVTEAINGKMPYTSNATTNELKDADRLEAYCDRSSESSPWKGFRSITWANVKATLKTYFDTLYSTVKTSKAAVSGGTELSLVTTGEKYNWNNPSSIPITVAPFSKSDIYSTTEKVVGCWTDGRPLYQKTIIKSIGKGDITITLKDEIANIGNLIDEVLLGKNSGVDHYETTPIKQTGVSDTKISYVKTGVSPQFPTDPTKYIVTCNWSGTGHSVALIIKYTKTTDAANSFKYADENDYSTTEHIVGSWIDGKPIYQKTIDFGVGPNKTTKSLAHGISNLKSVIDIKTIYNYKSSNYIYASSINSTDSHDGNSTYTVIDGNNIVVGSNANISTSGNSIYITLQYTKTTD